MYTEVTRIRKPDPHVHEGDPNPVHTEVAKMAVFGSDICADLSGSLFAARPQSLLAITLNDFLVYKDYSTYLSRLMRPLNALSDAYRSSACR